MDSSKIILNLPFDEKNGRIAYDYSRNRANGEVNGCAFVAGRNGNAIKFTGGGTCEIEESVLDLTANFSIIAFVQAQVIECGSPDKLIWGLNFGQDDFVEVPVSVNPGVWYSIAMTKGDGNYNFYLNNMLARSFSSAGTLLGLSLNQNCYGGDYGKGLLDDVRIYNMPLSQSEIIQETTPSKQVIYKIDGVDFKDYGVYVSASDGILNKPKIKAPFTASWDNYHGEVVDLNHKFAEPREITLSCFIKAKSKGEFMMKVSEFEHLFDKSGTNRLCIEAHPTKPLIYEVYCKDEISISKKWDNELMVGTFKIKLMEPEPVKRILKHIKVSAETQTCEISIVTQKYVNIYWGDGDVTYDVSAPFSPGRVTHNYSANGEYYVIITGCIEEIPYMTTNAIVVWDRI